MKPDATPARLMVLSVHPRHAARIISGHKTVELRRTRPNVKVGQPVALYVTSPTSAVLATCRIAHVNIGAPNDVKPRVLEAAGVTNEQYDRYYDRCERAVVLHLSDVTEVPHPITLHQIRETSAWHPPQTWHFMNRELLVRRFGAHSSWPHLSAIL